MRDISAKQTTLRTARATGKLLCSVETLESIKKNELPKGNPFDYSRAAGLLAAKNTHLLIPHCHPVSIDALTISFSITEDVPGISIEAEAKCIGRTGIEMEALTAVSVTALTLYDLLKPLNDKQLEITSVKLEEKTGGSSDRKKFTTRRYPAAVLVCSDSTAAGKREDNSGKAIQEILHEYGVETVDYKIIPDDRELIQQQIREWVSQDIPFIFTTGGTGLGPRDNTVDAVREILEKDAPGITEAMRSYGQMRTPVAMFSRSAAGSIGKTTIVTLPGSTSGASESLRAIIPAIFHARPMLGGGGH